jgi:phage baseplate assembly protein W
MAITTTHNSYGAPVSISVKRATASKYKKNSGFAYPLVGSFKQVTGNPTVLQNNKGPGGYFSKSYGVDLIRNNLRQLFLCEKGERVMLPGYGMSLNRYLFEPMDETTFFLMRNDILQTLKKYFSIVKVITLAIFEDRFRDHQLIVKLTLQLLDESLDIFDVEVSIT